MQLHLFGSAGLIDMQVDIGFGDIVYPAAQNTELPAMLVSHQHGFYVTVSRVQLQKSLRQQSVWEM